MQHTAIPTNHDDPRPAKRRREPSPTAFAYSVADACRMGGFGRTKAYELLKAGRLQKVKLDKKTLIGGASLRRLMASLGAETP